MPYKPRCWGGGCVITPEKPDISGISTSAPSMNIREHEMSKNWSFLGLIIRPNPNVGGDPGAASLMMPDSAEFFLEHQRH